MAGTGLQALEGTLACRSWYLTVIGVDWPGLDSDLNGPAGFRSPCAVPLSMLRAGRERGKSHRCSCVSHSVGSRGVHYPFCKNNFIAQHKNMVQHQKVRMNVKANLSLSAPPTVCFVHT